MSRGTDNWTSNVTALKSRWRPALKTRRHCQRRSHQERMANRRKKEMAKKKKKKKKRKSL